MQHLPGSDIVRRREWVLGNTLRTRLPQELLARAVPIGLHGDAASFSHQDSIYTISWNSLWGRGATVAKRRQATASGGKRDVARRCERAGGEARERGGGASERPGAEAKRRGVGWAVKGDGRKATEWKGPGGGVGDVAGVVSACEAVLALGIDTDIHRHRRTHPS